MEWFEIGPRIHRQWYYPGLVVVVVVVASVDVM
jgi:hypothetical protein